MRINITNDPQRIGQALRMMRESMGPQATLVAIAGLVGLSASFLSELERGEADPSLTTLRRLAVVYGDGLIIEFEGVEL